MPTLFKIAFRNIQRNTRRTVMTILAIAMGAVAMLVFGAFMVFIILGYRTGVVEGVGHLGVFQRGYLEVGSGNPSGYGIEDYERLTKVIADDPVLGPLVEIVTPTVTLYGLAGNAAVDSSKNFFGLGVVPADRLKMSSWNEYHLTGGRRREPLQLSDDDPTIGVVGVGMARILGLCDALRIPNCVNPPGTAQARPGDGVPEINLLAAATGGAPSVVRLKVVQAQGQDIKELDDSFVAMNLRLAQQLLFGKGERKVTSLEIQLHHTADIARARARLDALYKANGLDLETRDYQELTPQYAETIGMFMAIFIFIAAVMGLIVLFAVSNTMSMSVMERTNEIGTTRALGVRRSGVRREFLVEGSLLGVIGASAGVLAAWAVASLINASGITWTPPGDASPIPFRLLFGGSPAMIVGTWLGLVLIATFAAFWPAARAARMPVVDALRHV